MKTIGFERKPVKVQPAEATLLRLLRASIFVAQERRVETAARANLRADLVTAPWEGK